MLRLDRIGDVLMSLPALHDLRAALPRRAHPPGGRRAGARRSRSSAPVDEVLVWSAPWAGRAAGRRADGFRALRAQGARRCARRRPTWRSTCRATCARSLLMRADRRAAARGLREHGRRATCSPHVVPLDETVSWVEQNRRAVAAVVGTAAPGAEPSDAAHAPRTARSPRGCSTTPGPRAPAAAGRRSTRAAGARSSSGRSRAGREVARACRRVRRDRPRHRLRRRTARWRERWRAAWRARAHRPHRPALACARRWR